MPSKVSSLSPSAIGAHQPFIERIGGPHLLFEQLAILGGVHDVSLGAERLHALRHVHREPKEPEGAPVYHPRAHLRGG
eukprot:1532466-Pyramimonas_sp.AAC.1